MICLASVRLRQVGVRAVARDWGVRIAFLGICLLLAATILVAPRHGSAGGLRLAHTYPSASSSGTWVEAFARGVGEELDIYIEVFGEGTLGHNRELLDAVVAGHLDAALLPVSTVAEEVPEFAVLELPALFPAAAERERLVNDSLLITQLNEAARERGLMLLGVGWSPGVLSSADADVSGLEDLQGKKIRTWKQLDAEYLKAVGATPVMLASSEVHSALQVGVLDAALTSMLATRELVRHDAVASIIWSDDFTPFLYGSVLVISEDVGANFGWEIVDRMRVIGMQTAREFHEMQLAETQDVISSARASGITVEQWSSKDVGYLESNAWPIWEDFASEVPNGGEILTTARSGAGGS